MVFKKFPGVVSPIKSKIEFFFQFTMLNSYVNLGLSILSSLNFNQRPARKVACSWALSNAWMGDRSAYCDSSKVINFLKTNTT